MKWKAWAGLTAVFLTGFILGIIATGGYIHYKINVIDNEDQATIRHETLKYLAHRLDLTPQQQAQIKPHLYEIIDDYAELARTTKKRLNNIIEDSRDTLGPYLTSEQLMKLNVMIERHKRKKFPFN